MSDIKYLTMTQRLNTLSLGVRVADKVRDSRSLMVRLRRRMRIALPDMEVHEYTTRVGDDLIIRPETSAVTGELTLDELNRRLSRVKDDFVLDVLPGNYAMEVLVACRYPVNEDDATLLYSHLTVTKRERFQVFRVSTATPREVYGDQVLSVLVTSHHIKEDAAPALLDEAKEALSLKIDL